MHRAERTRCCTPSSRPRSVWSTPPGPYAARPPQPGRGRRGGHWGGSAGAPARVPGDRKHRDRPENDQKKAHDHPHHAAGRGHVEADEIGFATHDYLLCPLRARTRRFINGNQSFGSSPTCARSSSSSATLSVLPDRTVSTSSMPPRSNSHTAERCPCLTRNCRAPLWPSPRTISNSAAVRPNPPTYSSRCAAWLGRQILVTVCSTIVRPLACLSMSDGLCVSKMPMPSFFRIVFCWVLTKLLKTGSCRARQASLM